MKVASYCRVSTDKNDQANSFVSQKRYFQEYIERHPEWELYQVYADEGITGTNTKKRVQFNRMVADAYEGKFQLIITKEVSRFSRNILDTISYTRELKEIGVAVQFVLDGINTMNPDAEMYLSIMASLAQEESRKISSRVVWGQTRQMEKGVVFGQSMLGYDVKDGKLFVNPKGAELVRLIFHKYALEQVCTSEIARFLRKEGYCTYRGNSSWQSNTIVKILNNEKYVGDLVQKKSYTPDYLTHEKKRNTGEVSLICITNHHEPIVSRELWNLTQTLLRKNNKAQKESSGSSNRYIFSGKIRCGECGANFIGRYKYLKDGTKVRRWNCSTAAKEGVSACSVGKLIRDDDALRMLRIAVESLSMNRKAIAANIAELSLNAIHTGGTENEDDPKRIQSEINHIQRKTTAVMDSYFSEEITLEDMISMKQYYEKQVHMLQNRLLQAKKTQEQGNTIGALKKDIYEEILSILSIETASEVFCKAILENITVFKDRHMELRLKELSCVFHFGG